MTTSDELARRALGGGFIGRGELARGELAGLRSVGEHAVVRQIGAGGMGVVLEVLDPRTGARRAAKLIRRTEPEARARFQREIELLARSDRHPGIVRIHSAGETPDGSAYMILDLIPGEDLAARLHREGRLAPRAAATLVRDVARALGSLHAQGIVHRDVKPSNILLDADADGAPRLTDFGIATAIDLERLTRSGAFLGTIGYCSPEQAGEAAAVGPAADVFSLGAVLFHALAGETPFSSESAVQVIGELARETPLRSVRTVAPEVPATLAAIVARALVKDPTRRYADARALALELDRFLEGQPVEAEARRWIPAWTRRRAALALTAFSVVGATAVVGLGARAPLAPSEATAILAATSDAVALARRVEGVAATKAAPPELLARLREHVATVARREADAPGATVPSLRSRLQVVLGLARPDEEVRPIRTLLVGALARKVSEDLDHERADPDVVRELLAVAAAALPEDLVGEAPDRGPPVGTVLVDALAQLGPQDRSRSGKDLASLAAARLVASPGDPAGRALRAYARLIAEGAAVKPFGPGRVAGGAAREAGLLADLERGASLPGEPGLRAAWLLVDLLAAAPDRDEAALDRALAAGRQALARAAATGQGAAYRTEAARIEEVVALSRLPRESGLAALLSDPASRDPVALATALHRLFSRLDISSCVERPELARSTFGPWLTGIVAREDLSPYWPPGGTPPSAATAGLRNAPQFLSIELLARATRGPVLAAKGDERPDARTSVRERIRAEFRRHKDELDALLARALLECPEDGGLLATLANPRRESFSAAPFLILAARATSDRAIGLAELYSPATRALKANDDSAQDFFEPAWELDGRHGRDAVEEFERRVRRDSLEGGDPALRGVVGRSIPTELVAQAVEASVGLKALEELRAWEGVSLAEQTERAWLVLRAAHGLDAYARLRGPGVLPFRARWSRLILPGVAGAGLARLDLARLERVARESARAARIDPSTDPTDVPFLGSVALVGACEAAPLEGGADAARQLARLGVTLATERVVLMAYFGLKSEGADAARRIEFVRVNGTGTRWFLLFGVESAPLRRALGWGADGSGPSEALDKELLELPGALLTRLSAREYFAPPDWP